MPINHLHRTLQDLLVQLRPAERITRVRNWSRLLVGLCLSRSVHLSKIANKIPTKATLPCATRRLSRLLDNAAIRVRAWYEPIARSLCWNVRPKEEEEEAAAAAEARSV